MDTVLDIAQERGYRFAVENHVGPLCDPYLVDYILNPNRADFRAVLPISPSAHVLDLGSGWGGLVAALAPVCTTVVAADTNPRSLKFIRIRAKQDGLANLYTTRIDSLDEGALPFPDASFDIVVLNGVLEYVGSTGGLGSPRSAQLHALRQALRVLKPGGTLYVGIENRYSYLYFLGTRDHNGFRYTSLLPRWAATAAMRWHNKGSYRTLTYSEAGYRELLQDAGFAAPEIHLPLPDYRQPRFIVPNRDARAIAFLWQRHRAHVANLKRRAVVDLVFKVLPPALAATVVSKVCPAFCLLAAKPG